MGGIRGNGKVNLPLDLPLHLDIFHTKQLCHGFLTGYQHRPFF